MYKLMITDDEPDILNGLSQLIQWEAYNIEQPLLANSCKTAIDLAVTQRPDIILADIQLDDGWGYEIIEELSNRGLNPIFIMISGYDDFNYVRRSFLLGAKEYILKPVNQKNLEMILLRIINEELGGNVSIHSRDEVDCVTGTPLASYTGVTQKIITTIACDYNKSISLTDISKKFKMNNKYIGRIFMKDTGLRFSEYLYVYRMTLAKDLIKTTNEKIITIAHAVGYNQLNHFYTHFKSFFNLSPGDLRIELGEDTKDDE